MRALSPETTERLARDRNVWLATLRADGSAHLTPVWFLHRDGTFWVGCGDRSVKVRNVLADPRVSVALEDGDAPTVAEGRAHVHRTEFPSDIVKGFADKYGGWDITAPDQPGGARVLLEIPVRRWLSAGRAG